MLPLSVSPNSNDLQGQGFESYPRRGNVYLSPFRCGLINQISPPQLFVLLSLTLKRQNVCLSTYSWNPIYSFLSGLSSS